MSRGLGPSQAESREQRAGSTSRAPGCFAPSGQGLPATRPAKSARPRPQLRAPGLRARRRGRGSPAGPGAERGGRGGGGSYSRPRRPLPPGLRRPPVAPREGGAGEGLAPAWGAGPGGAGPGEAPGEGHRSGGAARGAERSTVGAGSQGRQPSPPGALAGLGHHRRRRRLLRDAPASRSARS
jgi:translation initiation factor IF-2